MSIPPNPITPDAVLIDQPVQAAPTLSWRAVFAGVVVAGAVQVALSEICLGAGLAAFEPNDPDSSASAVAVGTAIAWFVCGLIAVFAGAWVTGRLARFSGKFDAGLHGALVWAMGSLLALLLTVVSLGAVAGGAVSFLGQSIGGVAQIAAPMAGEAVKAAAPDWQELRGELSQALDRRVAGEGEDSDRRYADRSRLMELLGGAFNAEGRPLPDNERNELLALVSSQLGISKAGAETTLAQWERNWRGAVQRVADMRQEAKQKAKEAATIAKRRASQAATIAFFVMLAGLAAAVVGSVVGSCHCHRNRLRT